MQKCSQGRGSSRMTGRREGGEQQPTVPTLNRKRAEHRQKWWSQQTGFPRLLCSHHPSTWRHNFGRCLKCLEILSWRSMVWERVTCSLGSLGNLTHLVPTQVQVDSASARSCNPSVPDSTLPCPSRSWQPLRCLQGKLDPRNTRLLQLQEERNRGWEWPADVVYNLVYNFKLA